MADRWGLAKWKNKIGWNDQRINAQSKLEPFRALINLKIIISTGKHNKINWRRDQVQGVAWESAKGQKWADQ